MRAYLDYRHIWGSIRRWGGFGTAELERAAGFFDATVTDALADFEGGCEAHMREIAFSESEVCDAAEVQAVGFTPGVLAVGVIGTVECFAGVL